MLANMACFVKLKGQIKRLTSWFAAFLFGSKKNIFTNFPNKKIKCNRKFYKKGGKAK